MAIVLSLPRQFGRENRLLRIYYEGLSRHWGWHQRTLGNCLYYAGFGTGWSDTERSLLTSEIRAAGVSMAARRGVHRLLNPAGYPRSTNLLRNKARFARYAVDHALPTPETFDPCSMDLDDWLEARTAIIAKPGFSSKGEGIVVFRRAGQYWEGKSRRLTTSQLSREMHRILSQHGVLQQLVSAHPALTEISPDALPTLRIVTCRDEAGEPENCVTILRLGAGRGQPIDNFSAGGLAVRVDKSRRCAAAYRANGAAAQDIRHHPDSGAKIIGREVPDIDQAADIALRAHRTLPAGYSVVGWDIGLADRGPMIVEGNWNPGTQIIQLVESIGLDETRLGELYRFHLDRVSNDQWRSARPIEW